MKREKFMSNLEFSVKLKALTDGFNKGINQAGNTFGGFQTKLNHAMQAIEDNAQSADKAIETLFNELSDTPLPQAMQKVSTELSQMGAGALLTESDVKRAMGLISSHIDGLNDELQTAEKNMKALKDADIVNTQKLNQAKNSVKTLTAEFKQSSKETEKLNKELEKSRDKLSKLENSEILGSDKAEEAKRYIADLEVEIKEAATRVNGLEKQLNSAKNKTKSLSNSFKETNKETTQLNRALKKAESSLEKLEKKQVVDSDKVAEANANIAKLKQEIEQSTNKAENFSKQLNSAKDKTKSLSLEFRESKKEVTSLNTTLKNTKNNLEKLEDKGVINSDKVAEAKRVVSELESKLRESSRATEYFSEEVDNANEAVKRLSNQKLINDSKIKEATNDVKTLSDEIRNANRASDNFEEQTSKAMQRAEQSAESARNAMLDMLNVRTDGKIRAEIAEINKAYIELKHSGTLSQNELAKASEAHSAKLKELQAQLGRTSTSAEDLFNIRSTNTVEKEIDDVSNALERLRRDYELGRVGQVDFNRKVKAGEERLNTLQAELGQTSQELRDFDSVTKRTSSETSKLSGAVGGLQGMLATLGVTVGVSELIQMADAFKTLEARVKLATGEGDNFITGFEGVKKIANDTFTSIEDTGTLFARISQAGEEMNLAQKDVLEITESINQAIKLSGGSAESNQAAITQLIQGLQSGVVRGEEFNSIMEQAPRLAKAMADGLGVTRGELRAMAEEGKLTSEVVIGAIQGQSDTIANEFGQLPLTVGNSLIQLKNNIMTFVGDIDKEINSSGGLASVIKGISDGIEDIDPTTVEAVKDAFEKLGGICSGLIGVIKSITDGTTDFTNALGGVEEGAEQVNILTRMLQVANVALGGLEDGLFVIANVINSVFGGWTLIIGNIVKAFEILTGRTNELSENIIKRGNEMLSKVGKNVEEFKSATGKAFEEMLETTEEKTKKASEVVEKSYDLMALEIIEKFGDVALSGKSTSEEISKAFSDSLANIKTKEGIDELVYGMLELQNQGKITGKQMAEAINQATAQYKELEIQTDRDIDAILKMAEESKKANDGMISDEVKHQASLKGLKVWLDENGKAYVAMANTATESARTIKDKMANTAKALGIDFELASNKVSKSMQKSVTDVQTLASNFDALKEQGYNASNLIAQGLQNMADKAKNKADYEKLISLWREFGDQGKVSTKQVEAGIDAVNQKLQKSPQYLDETKKAFQELGIISKAEAEKQALAQMEAFEKVKASGQASTEQLQEALENMSGAIEASGDTAVQSWYDAQKSAQGMSEKVEETTRAYENQAVAIKEVEQADKQANASQSSNASEMMDVLRNVENAMKGRIDDLQEYGATAEQTKLAFDNIMRSQFFEGQSWADIDSYGRAMETLNAGIERQVSNFENARNRAIEHTQALGSAEVTTKDLINAKHALRKTTDANVQGLIRMDSQTLNNLRSAIDSTRNKMENLADTARDTADNLEITLARLNGHEDKARELEQAEKIAEIEAKISDARERNNREEVQQYQKALALQKRVNEAEREQSRKAKRAQKMQEQERESKALESMRQRALKLEAELAKSRGEDSEALKIEQGLKLQSLQEEINKKKDVNDYLKKALSLQKQINEEERKQQSEKEKTEKQKSIDKQKDIQAKLAVEVAKASGEKETATDLARANKIAQLQSIIEPSQESVGYLKDLNEIAQRAKHVLNQKVPMPSESNQQPNKTINVNLSANNSPPVNATIPASQEELFMNFIKRLEESKMMSGRA